MATIRDIAKLAGVSLGTASRAITGNGYVSEDTRRAVLEIARELDYRPRVHAGPRGNTGAVGVLLPDITFPFYGAFLRYAEVELAQRGYKTVVCNTLGVQGRVGRMLELLERRELDGLIVNADVTGPEIARMEKLPVVSHERLLGPKIPMVSSDHKQGGQLAAAELLRCGCRHVLIFTARHNNQVFGDVRITECRRILQEQNVQVTVAEIPAALLSYRLLKELTAEYMRMYSGVDGIFTDDTVAYCCLEEAKALGIPVPEKLKIVGYDGNELMKISTPRITTVEQDLPRLTRSCVDLLLQRMAGERTEPEVILPVTFSKGGTT